MKKAIVLFAGFTVGVSYAGVLLSSSILPYILSVNQPWTTLRIVLAFVLLSYGLFSFVRRRSTRFIMGGLGILLLALAVAGIANPGLPGLSNFFPLPLDILILAEGGVLSLLAALTLPMPEREYRSNRAFDANYLQSWLRINDRNTDVAR